MDLDLSAFYNRLEQEIRSSTDFQSSLSSIMHWCAEQMPHRGWAALSAFDAPKELKSARAWIPRVLQREPCPFPVRGVYFGLGEFQLKGAEYADLYFGLMSQYNPDDAEAQWLWAKPRHYPEKALPQIQGFKTRRHPV